MGRSLTNYCHRQSRFDLGKINLLPINIDLDSEKKIKSEPRCPSSPLPSPPFPQTQLHSFTPNSSASSPQAALRDREWGLWAGRNGSSLRLLPPHAFPLLHRRPLHGLQLPSGHTHLLLCGVCRSHTEPLLGYLQPFHHTTPRCC